MHPEAKKDALHKLVEAQFILKGVQDKPEGLTCLLNKLTILIQHLDKMPVGEW